MAERERKPRQRRTFAEKIADIEERIKKHRAAMEDLYVKREVMLADHRKRAKAMLEEAGPEANPQPVPE